MRMSVLRHSVFFLCGLLTSTPSVSLADDAKTLQSLDEYALKRFIDTKERVHEDLKVLDVDVAGLRPTEDSYSIHAERFTKKDLARSRSYDQMTRQVDEIVTFINKLYVAGQGDPDNLTIRHVTLMPVSEVPGRRTLVQTGHTLTIGLPRWWFYGFDVHSAEDLRDWFDRGVHLDKGSKLRKYWPYLNPVGNFRTQLHQSILKAGKVVGARLGDIHKRFSKSNDRDALLSEIMEIIETESSLSPSEKEKLIKQLHEKSMKELLAFVSDWKSYIADPSNVRVDLELSDGSIDQKTKSRFYNFSMGASHSNTKRVWVTVRLSTGGTRRPAVAPTRMEDDHKVVQVGLLWSVHTVDDIRVNFMAEDEGIVRSGLDHALRKKGTVSEQLPSLLP